MAKPNYSFEKRQRELAKKKKKEEKANRRAAAHGSPAEGGAPPQASDGVDASAPAAGSVPTP